MIPYKLIRSNRRTLAIQLTAGGAVLVRSPRHVSRSCIDAFVKSKEDWIYKHLSERKPRQPPLPAPELAKLTADARVYFSQKTEEYAGKMGISYGNITIRHQKTRWGSCSSRGNLNFNCLLMLSPENVREYVIVHELCHRKQMNHSQLFWAEVEKVLPDYRERRQWLKANGGSLIGRVYHE